MTIPKARALFWDRWLARINKKIARRYEISVAEWLRREREKEES